MADYVRTGQPFLDHDKPSLYSPELEEVVMTPDGWKKEISQVLAEDGSFILQEDGNYILIEQYYR